jgi:hypothetical protein
MEQKNSSLLQGVFGMFRLEWWDEVTGTGITLFYSLEN